MRLRVLDVCDPGARSALGRLVDRLSDERSVDDAVYGILDEVRRRGDDALIDLTERFDRVRLDSLWVPKAEIEAAARRVDADVLDALRSARDRIEAFHRHELPASWEAESDGVTYGQLARPLDTVGIYAPGGEAAYPSTVLMNAVPARLVGVRRLVLATPPGADGSVSAMVLAAARLCGIDEVVRVGGAQAIGALAFGTETIPRVDKIVGPGNVYVNAAKRLVGGWVGIDGLAGPSEVVVLADDAADADLIAADLLAQAEHDVRAMTVLVTPSRDLAERVGARIEARIATLDRRDTIARSLEEWGACVLVADLDEGVEWVNRVAPEHLEVMTVAAFDLLPRLTRAGMILLGAETPVSLCDYGTGPNHVLPTGGTARFGSPLGIEDFVKRTNYMAATGGAPRRLIEQTVVLAKGEGLTAHAEAALARLRGRGTT